MLLKGLLLFLLLQELSRRAGLRGLTVKIPGWNSALVGAISLGLILFTVSLPTFSQGWISIGGLIFVLTLALACAFPTPRFPVPPRHQKASGGVTGTFFSPPIPRNHLTIYLHGGGNDALFDNYSLIENTLAGGSVLLCVNLPGHGKGDSSMLDPEESARVLRVALGELIQGQNFNSVDLIGESLGGIFALEAAPFIPNLKRLDLLAVPASLPHNPLGYILEALHFFGFQWWWQLSEATLWEALPAFGPVKRQQFPVRTSRPHRYREFDKIARHTQARLISGELVVPPTVQVRNFHGIFDGVVPYRHSWERTSLLEKMGTPSDFIPLKSFHLSVKRGYLKVVYS